MCSLRRKGDLLWLLGWNARNAVEELHLQRQFALWFREEPISTAVELSPTDVAEEEDPPEISPTDIAEEEDLDQFMPTLVPSSSEATLFSDDDESETVSTASSPSSLPPHL